MIWFEVVIIVNLLQVVSNKNALMVCWVHFVYLFVYQYSVMDPDHQDTHQFRNISRLLPHLDFSTLSQHRLHVYASSFCCIAYCCVVYSLALIHWFVCWKTVRMMVFVAFWDELLMCAIKNVSALVRWKNSAGILPQSRSLAGKLLLPRSWLMIWPCFIDYLLRLPASRCCDVVWWWMMEAWWWVGFDGWRLHMELTITWSGVWVELITGRCVIIATVARFWIDLYLHISSLSFFFLLGLEQCISSAMTMAQWQRGDSGWPSAIR